VFRITPLTVTTRIERQPGLSDGSDSVSDSDFTMCVLGLSVRTDSDSRPLLKSERLT